jgi:integrase
MVFDVVGMPFQNFVLKIILGWMNLYRKADLLSVSALMGHSSIRTTVDIYGHSSDNSKRRAVALLEDKF